MKISIVFPSPSSLIPSSARLNQPKICNPNHTTQKRCTNQPFAFRLTANAISRAKAQAAPRSDFGWGGENTTSFELEDEETEFLDDGDSPWEGAIVYARSPSITHVEYCTTLERLGLGHVSSQVSRHRASEMGIRVTKAVKDFPLGTPVQVSVDVTRKVKRLRLDGILKTVLSLRCNSCGEAAGQSIFSNFTLLLSSEPIEEPEVIDLGTLVGNLKNKGYTGIGDGDDVDEDEDDEASIDFEDRLYFPMEEKEIDISKHIRDLLHLEINISTVCGPSCRGICMRCGANLNTRACSCAEQNEATNRAGPLGNLKQRMQAKS